MKNLRGYHVVSALTLGGVVIFALNFNGPNPPLFENTDNFVLLAQEKINLAAGVTVSSGDVGVNDTKGSLDVGPTNILTSNLFASRMVLGPESIVNGNAFFDKLTKTKDAQILGDAEQTFQSPLVDFPAVPDFTTGTQRLKTKPKAEITISPGSFKDINIGPDSTITLNPGTYNTEALTVGKNTTLSFLGTTTINIKKSATIGTKVVFSATSTPALEDIKINSQGKELRIGNGSITSGIITAPDATLHIGARTLHRGQLIAKHINIGRDAILSISDGFVKESSPEDVATGSDGATFIINEFILDLTGNAELSDALELISIVNGRITGFLSLANAYQIEVNTTSVSALGSLIITLENLNDPRVESIYKNYTLEIF